MNESENMKENSTQVTVSVISSNCPLIKNSCQLVPDKELRWSPIIHH